MSIHKLVSYKHELGKLSELIGAKNNCVDITLAEVVGCKIENIKKINYYVELGKYGHALKIIMSNSPIKNNFDYSEGLASLINSFISNEYDSIVDAARGLKSQSADDSAIPTESYCGSKRNIDYWSALKKEERDEFLEDFIKYIQEIDC